MFSKELAELDKNTVQYMIDELQDTIDAQNLTINEQNTTIDAQKVLLDKKDDMIHTQKVSLDQKDLELQNLKNEIETLKKRFEFEDSSSDDTGSNQ